MIKHGFVQTDKNGATVLQIPSFLEYGFIRHCFTTRIGGVSPGAYASLNLSKTREENEQNKEENYRRVCGALDVPYESLTLVNYEHGNGVHCAAPEDAGTGVVKEQTFPHCDALLTNASGVTAVTLHADCVPIFMADTKSRAVGVGHAGWKGVCAGIAREMIRKMGVQYGSAPEDIVVGIGPHIGPCCFEVQEDVAAKFREPYHAEEEKGGKLYVSLQKVLLLQLLDAGIKESSITCANLCTHCREDLFYSHRRDAGNTGAMGSFISPNP